MSLDMGHVLCTDAASGKVLVKKFHELLVRERVEPRGNIVVMQKHRPALRTLAKV
jgi:hypothetical protein